MPHSVAPTPAPEAPADRRLVRAVRARVRAALADAGPVLLAVSGGRDSLVLLDAACAVARDRIVGVATFDHGTGAHARAAVARVRRAARRRGLPVLVGRAVLPDNRPMLAINEGRYAPARSVPRFEYRVQEFRFGGPEGTDLRTVFVLVHGEVPDLLARVQRDHFADLAERYADA